jgi:hypothetical protein
MIGALYVIKTGVWYDPSSAIGELDMIKISKSPIFWGSLCDNLHVGITRSFEK